MEGWIKLHRKMREWQHYQNPSVRMVFEDLLFAANSKRRYFHGIEVKRGETMISVSSLEFNTGLSRKTVIRALNILEDTGEIKRTKFPHGIKTTITGYDAYQSEEGSGSNGGTDGVADSGIIPPLTPPSTPPTTPPEQEGKKERIKEDKNNIISLSNESVSGNPLPDPQTERQESVDFVGLMTFFNRTMDETNSIIPRVQSIKGKREGNVRARIKEYGLDKVYEMISKASRSDFLNGKNSKGWRADFSWLFLPTNFQKVLEGNYDNGNNQQQQNWRLGRIPGQTEGKNPLVGYDKIID